jgi:hypothetical protein
MKPAAERIDKNWAAIEKYFLVTVPELASCGDRSAKDAVKAQYTELEVSQPGTFTESRKFIQLCLSLPTTYAAVERGFSQTKMILDSRECLSLQSLIAQRVGKEAIHLYGSSSKVPITPSLLSMQFRAYQNHQRRVKEEQKEKKKRDESI